MKLRIALVTAREALALDEDMAPLLSALASAGAKAEPACWDDAGVAWGSYDAALLRSTWDYADRLAEFLDWSEHCARQTRLLNPPDVVRWNTDKHYLAQLSQAGVPVVPTRFVEPGREPAPELDAFLSHDGVPGAGSGNVAWGEFVVKPAIGAGSRDAARYARADAAVALEHLRRLTRAGRSALLQPYLDRVDERGETAVLYLGGRFSHAIRKGPLLRRGAGLVQGLFAPEDIRPREADADELRVAAAAFAAIPFDAPVYARIDLIRDRADAPVVLELELTEPSLFLDHAPGAADRLARHLVARLAAG